MTNLQVAQAEHARLLIEHEQESVEFVRPNLQINGRLKAKFGRTMWDLNEGEVWIELARWAVDHLTAEEIVDTIRHEWAHVIAGHHAGHGPRWRAQARRLGANPESCAAASSRPTPKWTLVCGYCNSVLGHRHRNNGQRFIHTGCGGSVVFALSKEIRERG